MPRPGIKHPPPHAMTRRYLPILLVLLLAFGLRTYQLTNIPPGLTHDEANHGREAIGILGGQVALFFPLNYGSEPLYSYTVAGSMLLAGRNMLALRLVNVYFGVLAIAATYLWTRQALNRRTALLAAALLAISFWPVAASREALRAGMMPFFTIGAVIFFWQLLPRPGHTSPTRQIGWTLGFALCLTATLYNYLAARVLWLMFPLFLAYLALFHRALFRRAWWPTVAGLLLVGLSVIPMVLYLQAHPEAQTRLTMLDGTLQRTLGGQLTPLLTNAREALLAFIWPGRGDQFLAYNIPGRAVFDAVSAVFFVLGLGVSLWRWRQPAYAFLLIWFAAGILPSLITGPTANTTRNLGALAPTFILPAVGFVALGQWLTRRGYAWSRPVSTAVAALWLLFAAGQSTVDYFGRWAQSPDVRAAYQHTLVTALDYLDEQAAGHPAGDPIIISSVYPGPAHNPSIALVLANASDERRWVDARYALVLPGDRPARLVAMAATPLHPLFATWVSPVTQVDLRPDDLNPFFTVSSLPAASALADELSLLPEVVSFGADSPALRLVGYRWLADSVAPGGVAELMQVWQVVDPAGVGPIVPPFYTTDVVFFTHVLGENGQNLFQADALDAPSWDWQAGDLVVQIHQLAVPADIPAGVYTVAVGVYDRLSGSRLPVRPGSPNSDDTRAFVGPLLIQPD